MPARRVAVEGTQDAMEGSMACGGTVALRHEAASTNRAAMASRSRCTIFHDRRAVPAGTAAASGERVRVLPQRAPCAGPVFST